MLFSVAALFFQSADIVRAEALRTQVIQLNAGWNSVYLEVDPTNADPDELFAGLPIDIVAAPVASGLQAQFSSNPGVSGLDLEGWGCWYEKEDGQSFLDTLFSIHGTQGYLIHCQEATALSVTGAVRHSDLKWRPGQFNFVGFSVMTQGAPTFAQFFQGSAAHQHNRIYRMVSGSWRQIEDPSAVSMRSGEAFWVFCDGPSRFQGPLRAVPNSVEGMKLATSTGLLSIYNDTTQPVALTLDHIATSDTPSPLSIIVQTVHSESPQIRSMEAPKPAGDWTLALPAIEAGRSQGIPLQARLADMTLPEQSSLLRVTTDIGTEIWISVDCLRKDLVGE